jgi:hypothetical protein
MPGELVGGEVTEFSLFKVETIEDFLSTLEISASATVQAGYGKGGAKARYFRKVKTHDYALYIAAVVEKGGPSCASRRAAVRYPLEKGGDRETFLRLNPLLALLAEAAAERR